MSKSDRLTWFMFGAIVALNIFLAFAIFFKTGECVSNTGLLIKTLNNAMITYE